MSVTPTITQRQESGKFCIYDVSLPRLPDRVKGGASEGYAPKGDVQQEMETLLVEKCTECYSRVVDWLGSVSGGHAEEEARALRLALITILDETIHGPEVQSLIEGEATCRRDLAQLMSDFCHHARHVVVDLTGPLQLELVDLAVTPQTVETARRELDARFPRTSSAVGKHFSEPDFEDLRTMILEFLRESSLTYEVFGFEDSRVIGAFHALEDRRLVFNQCEELLQNARDAVLDRRSDRDDEPHLQLRLLVAHRVEGSGKEFVIEVEDRGEGIDRDVLPRIFEEGFSTKASSGRGLGMAGLNRTAQMLGGTLKISTERGFGTAVRLSIPIPLMRLVPGIQES